MPPRTPQTLLTALGFSRPAARLYERLLPQDGQTVAWIAAAMDLPPERLRERLDPLVAGGAVGIDADERVRVRSPADVVSELLRLSARRAEEAGEHLQEIAAVLPLLTGTTSYAGGDAVELSDPIDGELTSGSDWVQLIRTMLRSSVGEILWLRPDQWSLPWEAQVSEVVVELLAAGRPIRAIYPVRVLADAPEFIRLRAVQGEEIRLLPEVPTRMIVAGRSQALFPEPLGLGASPRTTVRQSGIVELAGWYFEELWARATPLAAEPAADPDEMRRFLLAQLARGAQDEQIARRLGVSLRTVRRRVAELLAELGAESRFQAGVEAARRGWL
ncbi:MAG: helix-turn-helix transcriptional regulator [Nocardioides sp.]|uniref:helix-turn-helix transcriptional regulator n=1 Tax=Nocardioides sp. TaxID=35761 RepID=UPI0039E2526D